MSFTIGRREGDEARKTSNLIASQTMLSAKNGDKLVHLFSLQLEQRLTGVLSFAAAGQLAYWIPRAGGGRKER